MNDEPIVPSDYGIRKMILENVLREQEDKLAKETNPDERKKIQSLLGEFRNALTSMEEGLAKRNQNAIQDVRD